jgi:hypothetical protein
MLLILPALNHAPAPQPEFDDSLLRRRPASTAAYFEGSTSAW